MRDINEIMPKFPNMKWGALMNWQLSNAEVSELVRRPPFPEDKRWHTMFQDENNIYVDNITIRKRSAESMT